MPFKPNIKIFNLEIQEPIDFENQLIIDDLIRNRMLGHLNCQYNIQCVNLSVNRRENYVLIVVTELFTEE